MTDGMIIAAIGIIGGLIAIITPIVRLNGNIVRLTVSVDALKDEYKEGYAELKSRVTEHGKEIDELSLTVAKHDTIITNLERK